MARLRTIKPSFFTNEELVMIEPIGRLLFAGLWTLADRRGRLEDRPMRIKIQVLPCDECDVDALLDELQAHGFILRYEAEGARYIQVLAFEKHQAPHIKEAESTIPAPGEHGASTVPALVPAPPVNFNRLLSSVNRELEPEPELEAEEARAAARGPHSRRPQPPKGEAVKNLAPIFDAFNAASLDTGALRGVKAEQRAANELIRSGVPPGDIAECWADVRAGRYGDLYAQQNLSFAFLASHNRIGNWQQWRDAGKPAQERPNGATTSRPNGRPISQAESLEDPDRFRHDATVQDMNPLRRAKNAAAVN